MRAVTVEAVSYTVSSGIIGITGAQAKTRLHNLKPVKVDAKTGDGEYEVLRPVQFKLGEKFGFSGQVGKDGRLRDPEAEQISRMESEDQIRAELRAEYAEKVKGIEAQLAAKVEQAKGELVAALLKRMDQGAQKAVLAALEELKKPADQAGKK